jgi:dTDP-4-amino-4,6-dideoxygalactose transaminase
VRLAEIPILRPSIGARELEAVHAVLESRWLGTGGITVEFEEQIRDLVGSRHAVAVASGSAALHVSLLACGLRPGDEVILPSITHVSCAQAVLNVGAYPVFCDVHTASAAIDVEDAASRVTSRTRVLMPMHYAGFAARLDDVVRLALERELVVVEDAAHAFGSLHGERMIGSIGDLTCFSFDPVKNITCGEGGAVTTEDDDVAERLRRARSLGVERDSWGRRDHERPWYYEATAPGLRYQLSDLNAAIGLAQLARFDELRSRKQDLLRRYRDALEGLDGVGLVAGDIDAAFPFMCVVRVFDGRRDALLEHLREDGVQASVHFVPLHAQPAFSEFGGSLPVAEQLFEELLTLPLHPELLDADVDYIAASVRRFVESR